MAVITLDDGSQKDSRPRCFRDGPANHNLERRCLFELYDLQGVLQVLGDMMMVCPSGHRLIGIEILTTRWVSKPSQIPKVLQFRSLPKIHPPYASHRGISGLSSQRTCWLDFVSQLR